MLLIPFPFLTAAGIITSLLVLRGTAMGSGEKQSGFFTTFMVLCALQSLLTGIRHGYGISALAPLLPVTALMIPPVAWASFSRPALNWTLSWYVLPSVIAALSWWVFPLLIDILVPGVFIYYAAKLLRMATGPESGLSWLRLGQMYSSRRALLLIAASLIISALADIAIALAFGVSDGQRFGQILMLVQVVCIFGICLLLWQCVPTDNTSDLAQKLPNSSVQTLPEESNNSTDILARADYAILDACVRERKLYLDPALSLKRLARKAGVPTRRVSQAVNIVRGESISIWINNFRIEEAMQLLRSPQQTITEIIYSSGFNTKSSFNREFKRVTGEPPSSWRKTWQESPTNKVAR